MGYTFSKMREDLRGLTERFPQTEWGIIGKSVHGKELYYIRLGCGATKLIYNGSHHGMESITSAMLMLFAQDFLYAQHNQVGLGGYNVTELCGKASLYIVPMVNPDGVELASKGVPWQANARGVDLNHNYDAMWHLSRTVIKKSGISEPGPTRFPGPRPYSEPESRALAEFTRRLNPDLVIAFHSQGKVIYHGFMGKEPSETYQIAKAFETISPYVVDSPEVVASYGGYKDWFVKEFCRPGFTVEVGEGVNPLPDENLPIIYKETLPIMLGAMTIEKNSLVK